VEKVVIGLDIGTSSVKIAVCNFNKEIIYSDKEKFSEEISDRTTINPERLFSKIIEILSKTINNNQNFEIKAISISSIFPSLVVLDSNNDPITNIFTWADNRASSIVNKFKQNQEKSNELYRRTGCVIHESYSLWKLLWLNEHEPNIFVQACKFVSLSEYLTYKLTGKFIVSESVASTTGLYNIFTNGWDRTILEMVGISEDKLSQPYPIYHSEKLTDKFCSKIGLKDNPLLVLGAGDGLLSHLGSGCMKKGIMSSTIGTSGALRLSSNKPMINNPLLWCYCFDKNCYIFGTAINAGGSSINWFNEIFVGGNNVIETLDEDVSPNLNSPFFLPFLRGERGPNYTQNMKASFIGLSSNDDQTSIYRSILEGTLFNLYSCYQLIVKEYGTPQEIRASGGYINLDAMLQMQADIFNTKISVPKVEEAAALGAALIALKSLGIISDITGFDLEIKKTFYPNREKHLVYMERYQIYKKLVGLLSNRDLFL